MHANRDRQVKKCQRIYKVIYIIRLRMHETALQLNVNKYEYHTIRD